MTAARGRRPVLTALAFLGSFLLFQIEILAAKLLLPHFGGSAYVWTACMMFFQGTLLAGSLYSRLVLGSLGPGRYARWHLGFLLLPFLFFPISLPDFSAGAHPALQVLEILARAIGVPFFVLSTTTPVAQGWLALEPGEGPESSYSVYAASNAGALTALLGYPFLVEPFVALRTQLIVWQALYAAFALLPWYCLPRYEESPGANESPVNPKSAMAWFLLSLGPSAFLLAATNLLLLDFSAVPLLWIIPLAVYLTTLILNFKRRPWFPERLSAVVAASIVIWLAFVLATALSSPAFADPWQAFRRLWVVNKFCFVAASLFVVCMICHRALALAKPPSGLSSRFYVWTALGGWMGSVLIGVVIPWLARRTAAPELDWLIAGGLSIVALLFKSWSREGPPVWPGLNLSAGARVLFAAIVLGVAGFGFYLDRSVAFSGGSILSRRDFYGFYKVVEKGGMRKFYHGNTLHGAQYVEPAKRGIALLYHHRRGPLGQVFESFGDSFKSVAVIGLGVGAVAAYGRPGEVIDFYELDPAVAEIARDYFTFLKDSRAKVRVITGDGRISLEQNREARYDMVFLDAFTSGAIPAHLATEEALRIYLGRLSQDGILVFHITNRFLNLRPVLAAAALDMGLFGAARGVEPEEFIKDEMHFSSWVALSRDRAPIERLTRAGWRDLGLFSTGARPWTDQYASLWSALGG